MHWTEIDGWFHWRPGQDEAVAHFPSGSRFVEVGTYLGRSLCSLAEVVVESGKDIAIVGVDTCLGSGPEGERQKNYHGAAVDAGGGTFAGTLHRNIIACGYGDQVSVMVSTSVRAAEWFAEASVDWVHLDARHDFDSVCEDIAAWLPKVKPGGWLTGDDYDPEKWPQVVAAVALTLPEAQPWCSGQWRWPVPAAPAPTEAVPPEPAAATAALSGRRVRTWGRRLRGAPTGRG